MMMRSANATQSKSVRLNKSLSLRRYDLLLCYPSIPLIRHFLQEEVGYSIRKWPLLNGSKWRTHRFFAVAHRFVLVVDAAFAPGLPDAPGDLGALLPNVDLLLLLGGVEPTSSRSCMNFLTIDWIFNAAFLCSWYLRFWATIRAKD